MLLIFFWNLIWLRTLLHTRTLSRTHTEWPVAEEKIICVSALLYEYEFKCVRTFWQISSYHINVLISKDCLICLHDDDFDVWHNHIQCDEITESVVGWVKNDKQVKYIYKHTHIIKREKNECDDDATLNQLWWMNLGRCYRK